MAEAKRRFSELAERVGHGTLLLGYNTVCCHIISGLRQNALVGRYLYPTRHTISIS